MTKVVFLGGTCGNNQWRVSLIQHLIEQGVDRESLFNPVVADWTPECQAREEEVKATADYMLYYLGDPQEAGNSMSAYSMVEATMGLYDAPERTVIVFDTRSMPPHSVKSSNQALKVLLKRFPTATIIASLEQAEEWLVGKLVS